MFGDIDMYIYIYGLPLRSAEFEHLGRKSAAFTCDLGVSFFEGTLSRKSRRNPKRGSPKGDSSSKASVL